MQGPRVQLAVRQMPETEHLRGHCGRLRLAGISFALMQAQPAWSAFEIGGRFLPHAITACKQAIRSQGDQAQHGKSRDGVFVDLLAGPVNADQPGTGPRGAAFARKPRTRLGPIFVRSARDQPSIRTCFRQFGQPPAFGAKNGRLQNRGNSSQLFCDRLRWGNSGFP